MAEPIRIQISKGGTNAQTGLQGSNLVENTNNAPSTNVGVLKSLGAVQLARFGVQSAKSIVSNSISQYGNMTGDYIAQQRINDILSNGQQIMSLGGTILGGFMVGGVAGGIVSGALALGQLGVQSYINNKNYALSITRQNQAATFNSMYIGDVLSGGNR